MPYRDFTPAPRCSRTKRDGTQCGNRARRGGTLCGYHGGAKAANVARAQVRAAVLDWGLGDANIDPGETLLRLLAQAVIRANGYGAELAKLVERHGLHDALVGDRMVMSESGKLTKIDEYVRGLAKIEAEERDRAAGFAAKAIAAGLAKRQVELAERTGDVIAEVLRGVLTDPALTLTDDQRAAFPAVIRRHLQLAS